jgi:outer membrane protein TolC
MTQAGLKTLTRALALILSLLLTSAAIAQNPEKLTLDQAIKIALKNNRLLKNDELEVQKASERIAIAETYRLPRFEVDVLALQMFSSPDFHFKAGSLGTLPGGAPFPLQNTTINSSLSPKAFITARATQPLTQLPRISLNIKLQELNQQVAQNKLEAQRQQITNQVKRAYYAVLQTQSALAAMDESLKLHRELDRVVGDYVIQKVALTADSLDVKTQLANDEYEVVRLGNALASQQEQLNQLLGRDPLIEIELATITEQAAFAVDLAAARQRALSQRTELQEAKLKQEQAAIARRIKKTEHWPEISLTAGYFSPVGFEVLPRNLGAVGVSLKWEPFDWGRKRRELRESEIAIAQTENAAREAETQILLDVNRQHRKLQEARTLLRVAETAQTAANEKLRVATNKFRLEAALLKDVLQTRSAVADANRQYQQALIAFFAARADFDKAIGEQ